mmetsp:Transcript_1770/g.4312  ORF Transcript_1770/g.4312 Transcript_1770/m.4312 type:complete len:211 (-) Transcript_1770:1810-2442(-)
MEESSAFIDERKAGMISVLQKNAKEMLSDLQAVVDEMHSGKYDKAEKSPKKMMEHIKELRTNFMSCAHPCRGTPQPFQFPAPSAPRPAAALLACAHSAACVPDYQVMSAPSALLATRRSLGCSLRTFRGSTRPTRSCSGTPTSGPTCMTSSSSPRAGWMASATPWIPRSCNPARTSTPSGTTRWARCARMTPWCSGCTATWRSSSSTCRC